VSNTPRTDSMRGFHGLDTAVDAEFSEQLECELAAAQQRIKRLIEAGDEMEKYCTDYYSSNRWYKAKEEKL
jgi:hypothetical protein